jgi:hypothetical protein
LWSADGGERVIVFGQARRERQARKQASDFRALFGHMQAKYGKLRIQHFHVKIPTS